MIKNDSIHPDAQEHLFDGPIPGQSLTNSPDAPYPWEQAPEITSQKQATEKIFLNLLEEETLQTVLNLMKEGTPVMDITNMLLMTGFTKGKFNPDLMISLVEPTSYMLLALAEKAGIDPVLNRDDDDSPIEEENINPKDLKNLQEQPSISLPKGTMKGARINKLNPSSVGPDVKKQIETLDTSKLRQSILQKPKPSSSLLTKQGVNNG
jgi:hypothetical protein